MLCALYHRACRVGLVPRNELKMRTTHPQDDTAHRAGLLDRAVAYERAMRDHVELTRQRCNSFKGAS